jgi:HK97 family phage prohead protease
LWAHDYQSPPIGKAIWIRRDDGGIISKVKFANTEFAQEIFQLYKDGFLKAFSVGFMPKETEDGDGEKKPRRIYKKWELLEYSAVPVPANPEALSLAIQKGVLKTETIKKSIEDWHDEEIVMPEEIKEAADIAVEDAEQKPKPGKDESKEDFLKRCIPMLIDEGKDKDQAVAICHQLWADKEQPTAGLDELQAENKLLQEQLSAKDKEIAELRYRVYQVLSENKPSEPEIAVKNLADKVVEIFDGVIRKAQGKVK